MACWVCGAAGTWSLSAFHSPFGRTSFLFLTRELLGTQWLLLVRLSEPSSSPCLGFALRQFEFLIQMFLLSHSFQFVLHSNPFLVRIVSGSCLLSCMFAWSVTFEVAHSSSLSDITSAVSLCGVFRFFLILVCCLTGFATLI